MSRDDPVERIVEAAVAAAFAATSEMMRPMLREFALDLWRQWCEYYAGRRLPNPPKGTSHRLELRNERIREAARAGTSPSQLASDFHLSPSSVRRIIRPGDESA